MVIVSALLIGYLPILYFGILILMDQSDLLNTPSVVLALSLAYLNAIANPHIYGEEDARSRSAVSPGDRLNRETD